MVFLTISKKVTSVVGPVLLRTGLKFRNVLSYVASVGSGSGSGSTTAATTQQQPQVDNPYLDMIMGIPYAQKLISLAIYEESAEVVTKYNDKKRKQTEENSSSLDQMYDSLFGQQDQQQKQHSKTISELRMQVLVEKIRPALIPNEVWSDVMKWRFNARVIKWFRTEFLISKYGPQVKEALDAYPQIRSSPQLSKHPTQRMLMNLARGRPLTNFYSPSPSDDDDDNTTTTQTTATNTSGRKKTTMIPSSETLMKGFRMTSWAKEKHSQRIRQAMVPNAQKLGGSILEIQGTLLNYADIPLDAKLDNVTIEEILEVTGGHVVHCGPFNAICEEANIYQLWTKEYVEHLSDYLLNRCNNNNNKNNTLILDVGAGDGLLIQFMKEYMEQKQVQHQLQQRKKRNTNNNSKKAKTQTKFNMPTLIATDDGSWGIFAKAYVEKMSVEDAIEMYCLDQNTKSKDYDEIIVLCSWMPMHLDWTKMFRDANVDEYILIGEADDGTCGHNWETWGNPNFYFDNYDENKSNEHEATDGATDAAAVSSSNNNIPIPPYVQDGYTRWDMDVLSQFQFSRFDCAVSRSSKTVSFRRRNNMKKKKQQKSKSSST